jgi:hypothetical protein
MTLLLLLSLCFGSVGHASSATPGEVSAPQAGVDLAAIAWRAPEPWGRDGLPPGLARWNRYRVRTALTTQIRSAAGVLIALLVLVVARRERPRFEFGIKATHAIPVVIQLGIYSWWAAWHLPVRWYAPLLLAQLVYGFLLDGLLGLFSRGVWRVGLAPAPVVLSAGLFAWFLAEGPWMSTAVITAALGSKHLLHRGGRHIFNPSAFGLSMAGVAYFFLPDGVRWHGVVWELGLPPSMVELILLLALVAQTRVPVVLASLSALVGMIALHSFTGVILAEPLWAAPFLVIVLLLTDPATLPTTPAGRLLAGATYAVVLIPSTWLFVTLQGSDYWAKIVPVLAVNALAPTLDRWGAAIDPRLRAWLDPAHNRRHIAVWLAVVVGLLVFSGRKEGAFNLRRHAEYATPGVVLDGPRDAPCAGNPGWCRPFAFGWGAHRAGPSPSD